jgi:hypothetical protein
VWLHKCDYGHFLDVRNSTIFLKRFRMLRFAGSPAAKNSLASSGKSVVSLRAILLHRRGVCAIVTTRRTQDAMDAGGITRRVTRLADGEVVWSRPPDAGVKLVDEFTSDGG